ncbi:unnamed protein product [Effrenium voratum]|nr:unnamed protein product [Effrenium voratum]
MAQKQATDVFKQGQQQLKKAQAPAEYEACAQLFSEAISLRPNHAQYYQARGRCYLAVQQYLRALADFGMCCRLEPGTARHFGHRGLCFRRLGRVEEALRDYDEALRLERAKADKDPSEAHQRQAAEYYFERALVHIDLEQYDRAIEGFTQALDKRLATPYKAFFHRGICFRRVGQIAESIQNLKEAINLDTTSAEAHNHLGLSHIQEQNFEEARTCFSNAVELDACSRYLNNRGLACYHLETYEEAAEDFTAALEAEPGTASVLFNRGNAYFQLGHHREALEDYAEAIRLEPDNATYLHHKGLAFQGCGEVRQAIACYEEALGRDAGHHPSRFHLGIMYHADGQYDRHCGIRVRSIPYPLRGENTFAAMAAETSLDALLGALDAANSFLGEEGDAAEKGADAGALRPVEPPEPDVEQTVNISEEQMEPAPEAASSSRAEDQSGDTVEGKDVSEPKGEAGPSLLRRPKRRLALAPQVPYAAPALTRAAPGPAAERDVESFLSEVLDSEEEQMEEAPFPVFPAQPADPEPTAVEPSAAEPSAAEPSAAEPSAEPTAAKAAAAAPKFRVRKKSKGPRPTCVEDGACEPKFFESKEDFEGFWVDALDKALLSASAGGVGRLRRPAPKEKRPTSSENPLTRTVSKGLSSSLADARARLGRGQGIARLLGVGKGSGRTAPKSALEAFNGGVPADEALHEARGLVYRDMGDYETALLDFDAVIDLEPEKGRHYYNRGVVYHRMGRQEDAIEDLSRAIDLGSQEAAVFSERGLAWRAFGNMAQAVIDLTAAIEADGTQTLYLSNRAPDTHGPG